MPAPFGINVIGFISARLGLGVAARATMAALVASGVPVAAVDVILPDGRSNADTSWSHLYVSDPSALPHPVNLVHMNPPEAIGLWQQYPHWFAKARNVIVPFFELMDVPNSWVAHLSRYDAVFAPSEHIAAAVRNMLAVPVRRYPIAADVRNVSPAARAEYGIPENRFIFVTTFDTDSGLNRKNGIGALRAFASAFAGRSDATLVIKTNGIAQHPEFDRAMAAMPPESVVIVDQYLSYAQVLALYATCDAFVSLHRAEGLGLGLMEMMLLGKPVVATGWSGNMDFMSDDNAALVRYGYTPVVDTQAAYATGAFMRAQMWAEPDLLHAASLMLRLVDDSAYCKMLGQRARASAMKRRDAFFGGGSVSQLRGFYDAL